jgi:hypothetical protein
LLYYVVSQNGVTDFIEAETMADEEECETLSVPEAGRRYFNLGRNGSYDAAKRGEIPTMKVGRLLRVPIRAMEHKLDKVIEA